MKKYIPFILSGLLLTSCIDTIVLPSDKIVAEDYWKTKDDVSSMVAGAYKEMCSADNIERFIVWGEFRSENLDVNAEVFTDDAGKRTDLEEIKVGTMDELNQYAKWASVYSVINKCNIVIERAADVMSSDPSYTQSNYATDCSQMYALRALCYFYLVRAFRDVPVTEHAYFTSSQGFEVEQQAPLTVLNKCIDDLNRALELPLAVDAYTDWRSVGYINRDAIYAILADVYLWRASMTGDMNDYQLCVDYCDKVIESKQERYLGDNALRVPIPGSIDRDGYPLIPGQYAFEYNFIRGNSIESILELQCDGNNTSNSGLAHCYWNYDNKSRTYGFMMAPVSVFQSAGTSARLYKSTNDYRYYESCLNVGSSDVNQYQINKLATSNTTGNREGSMKAVTTRGLVNASADSRVGINWILYRLTDVMLMKAEALVQLAGDDLDKLRVAFGLANTVNKRSIAKATLGAQDTLLFSSYQSKAQMEEFVLEERQREFAFEGKHWFDLLRYTYRQLRSADNGSAALLHPEKTMAEIGGLNNYAATSNILNQATGLTTDMAMESEPYLYFPVFGDELDVNPLLHQNPAYISDETIVKQ